METYSKFIFATNETTPLRNLTRGKLSVLTHTVWKGSAKSNILWTRHTLKVTLENLWAMKLVTEAVSVRTSEANSRVAYLSQKNWHIWTFLDRIWFILNFRDKTIFCNDYVTVFPMLYISLNSYYLIYMELKKSCTFQINTADYVIKKFSSVEILIKVTFEFHLPSSIFLIMLIIIASMQCYLMNVLSTKRFESSIFISNRDYYCLSRYNISTIESLWEEHCMSCS